MPKKKTRKSRRKWFWRYLCCGTAQHSEENVSEITKQSSITANSRQYKNEANAKTPNNDSFPNGSTAKNLRVIFEDTKHKAYEITTSDASSNSMRPEIYTSKCPTCYEYCGHFENNAQHLALERNFIFQAAPLAQPACCCFQTIQYPTFRPCFPFGGPWIGYERIGNPFPSYRVTPSSPSFLSMNLTGNDSMLAWDLSKNKASSSSLSESTSSCATMTNYTNVTSSSENDSSSLTFSTIDDHTTSENTLSSLTSTTTLTLEQSCETSSSLTFTSKESKIVRSLEIIESISLHTASSSLSSSDNALEIKPQKVVIKHCRVKTSPQKPSSICDTNQSNAIYRIGKPMEFKSLDDLHHSKFSKCFNTSKVFEKEQSHSGTTSFESHNKPKINIQPLKSFKTSTEWIWANQLPTKASTDLTSSTEEINASAQIKKSEKNSTDEIEKSYQTSIIAKVPKIKPLQKRRRIMEAFKSATTCDVELVDREQSSKTLTLYTPKRQMDGVTMTTQENSFNSSNIRRSNTKQECLLNTNRSDVINLPQNCDKIMSGQDDYRVIKTNAIKQIETASILISTIEQSLMFLTSCQKTFPLSLKLNHSVQNLSNEKLSLKRSTSNNILLEPNSNSTEQISSVVKSVKQEINIRQGDRTKYLQISLNCTECNSKLVIHRKSTKALQLCTPARSTTSAASQPATIRCLKHFQGSTSFSIDISTSYEELEPIPIPKSNFLSKSICKNFVSTLLKVQEQPNTAFVKSEVNRATSNIHKADRCKLETKMLSVHTTMLRSTTLSLETINPQLMIKSCKSICHKTRPQSLNNIKNSAAQNHHSSKRKDYWIFPTVKSTILGVTELEVRVLPIQIIRVRRLNTSMLVDDCENKDTDGDAIGRRKTSEDLSSSCSYTTAPSCSSMSTLSNDLTNDVRIKADKIESSSLLNFSDSFETQEESKSGYNEIINIFERKKY